MVEEDGYIVGLAQSRDSTESNIVEVQKGATTIPGAVVGPILATLFRGTSTSSEVVASATATATTAATSSLHANAAEMVRVGNSLLVSGGCSRIIDAKILVGIDKDRY